MEINKIYHGDCLEIMSKFDVGSINMVLTDLPYGVTKNKWDSVIPLDQLRNQFSRILKLNGILIFTCQQPFTTNLIINFQNEFSFYTLVWDKVGTTGFQLAKRRPLRRHEDILIMYKNQPIYNPIMEIRGKPRKKGGSKNDAGCYGDLRSKESFNNTYYPTSIIQISNAGKLNKLHPTQKPVDLFRYLIRTYTKPGDVVLDCCIGSGTTAIAAMDEQRNFIGIELDEHYYNVAVDRIKNHKRKG